MYTNFIQVVINETEEERRIRVFGSSFNPHFCGKDICEILGITDFKKVIQNHVNPNHKKDLKDLVEEETYGQIVPVGVGVVKTPTLLGSVDLKNLSHNDGRLVVLSEAGVMDLLNGSKLHKNKKIIKDSIERWLWTIKYESDGGLMDIFSFIRRYQLAIDLESKWFQDLWYPLSKSQGLPGEALNVVQNSPIVVTQNLIEWLGYKGRKQADRQNDFTKLLDSLKVPYKEIDCKHPLAIEYPCVQEEVNLIPKNNIERKRWIYMEVRAFKNVVMRLNTETSDMVREYYLNLEEAMFGYGRYTAQYMMEKNNRQVQRLAIKDKAESKLRKQLAIKSAEAEQEKERAEQEKERAEQAEQEVKDNKDHILLLKDLLITDQKREKTQVIYIASSENYARQNRFKLGGVESVDKLKSRFSTYNSRSASGDEWYYSDTFLVADYHQIENRIKDLLGRFKDKKNKEIYILHYNNLRYIVEYLCNHYNDEVDEVNAKLTEFISNLNCRHLRPVVPPPKQINYANIVTLKEDGTVVNKTFKADTPQEFIDKLRNYIFKLDTNVTEISKKKVFDDLKVKKNRINKFPILQQLLNELRPEIKLKLK